MSETRGPCGCCLGFIISAGVVSLYLWLTFRHIEPRYYLTAFSLAGNLTALSSSFHFDLQVENKNRLMGLNHDPLSLSLAFNRTALGDPAVIPAFYQGHLKTALKSGNLTAARSRAPWPAALANGTAVFTVGLESAFRYKLLGRRSRHHKINVSCDVAVDAAGAKTKKKGIRLVGSAAPAAVTGSRRSSVAVALAVYLVMSRLMEVHG